MKRKVLMFFLIALLLLPGGCAKKTEHPDFAAIAASADRVDAYPIYSGMTNDWWDGVISPEVEETLSTVMPEIFAQALDVSEPFDYYPSPGTFDWQVRYYQGDEQVLTIHLLIGHERGWVLGYTIDGVDVCYIWDACDRGESIANEQRLYNPPEPIVEMLRIYESVLPMEDKVIDQTLEGK